MSAMDGPVDRAADPAPPAATPPAAAAKGRAPAVPVIADTRILQGELTTAEVAG